MILILNFCVAFSILITWYECAVKTKKMDFSGLSGRLGLIFGALTVVIFWPYFLYLLLTKYSNGK